MRVIRPVSPYMNYSEIYTTYFAYNSTFQEAVVNINELRDNRIHRSFDHKGEWITAETFQVHAESRNMR